MGDLNSHRLKSNNLKCYAAFVLCWCPLLSRIRIELDLSTTLDDVDSVVQ